MEGRFLPLLKIFQIFLSVLLAILILLQARGRGLSTNLTGMYRSKRGFEKLVFILTIIFGVLFSINSLLLVGLFK
ncbi:preprotein translocase subunit SecG [candidate division WWE3 bacterium RIFCSPHIGHO2_01_FULL_40_23]|uniref:Protein-export membrane protein SecG n=1 Tax=candidate division WWE3 bacterium RIFCSPLOWO2_01_FULL_41_18 TaxID=1802625 RepID=A0A1F4VCF6_UNCKA|nr:MAG: preprotein translocase subunit SecG [candidate division WWE3 bacterium RIFCSPHIGHO2_01_FULL_40_23]OGC54932.1 MAG: preprotein translocase subunit SecG [candidate division WWE3 bacterium RIFCSPLOWO2_01_FULL_41_18]